MANESFIQGKEVVEQINEAFYNHLNAVKQNVTAVNQLGQAYGKLPSDYLRSITQVTEAINRQTQAEQGLVQATTRANTARAAGSQRTQEEITNTRLLARNASLAAQANSTFANSYQRLTAQQAISATRVQDLIARGRTGTQTQREYNRELRNAQEEFGRLNSRVVSANRAVNRFNDNVGNYPQRAAAGLKDLIGAFGVVGGVTAFAAITKEIFNTTRELQSLDLALKNVTGSQEAFSETQEFLSRISEAYGIEINGLTKSYTGFLAASQNAIASGAISAQQIQDIFESVSKASGAMGLSVDQQQGAFLALQQMISKGSVQAEEIRGQLAERLPGAFGILAKSMGVTEQELNKLLKDGKVLAAEVLPAFAKELERAYGVENLERVESMAASTTRLSNAWTDLIREISEGDSVITKFFIGTLGFLDKMLKGFADLTKSSQKLRDEQLSAITQSGYQEQLKLLSDMKDEEIKLGTAVKERLSLYAANETIESGREQLKNLREQRSALDEILASYEAQGKGKGNVNVISTNREYNKSLNQTNLILGQIKAAQEFLNKENEKTTVKKIELTDKELKALEKARQEELENQYKLRRLILESEQKGFEEIMADVSLYYKQRVEAATDATTKEIALAELARKEGLRKAGDNTTQQLIVWEEYYKDFEQLAKKNANNIKKLDEEAFKEFKDYREKYKEEGLNVISTEDLASQFFQKQDDDAEKAAEKIKELKKATDDYLASFRDLGNFGFESLNKFLQIDENGKSPFQNLLDGADSLKEKMAITFAAVGDVAKEAFAFMTQNSQAAFDAEYVMLERRRDIAVKFAGENRAAQDEINRQYDERQREIKLRELKAQKEQAIFNAVINTAQGVTSALATANIPLSILIGALGAAQIAFIASRQIPAYADGGVTDTSGNILVNDAKGANYKEVVVTPGGKTIKPNGRNRVMNVPKGTRIFKNYAEHEAALNGMLANAGIAPASGMLNRIRGAEPSNGLTKSDLMDVMRQTVGSMTSNPVNVSIDHNGINTTIERGHSQMQLRNNHLELKGRTFGKG